MISVTSHTQPRETHTWERLGGAKSLTPPPKSLPGSPFSGRIDHHPHGSHSFPPSLGQSLEKILKYDLDVNLRASNLAQCVNLFATKPDNLTLIFDTHIVKVENQSTHQSCSLTQTLYHGAHTRARIRTHTHPYHKEIRLTSTLTLIFLDVSKLPVRGSVQTPVFLPPSAQYYDALFWKQCWEQHPQALLFCNI